MFLFQLEARRRLRFDLNSDFGLQNLNTLAQTHLETLPHPDTPIYLLKKLPLRHFDRLRTEMVRTLTRKRVLEQFRLLDTYYTIAVDGTGLLYFSKPHCPHCLTAQLSNGNTLYYHNVLEAKLIASNGLAISLASEFIENTDGDSKQDCELKAFYRLIPRLRKAFPQLRICLLLDALFLNQTVLDLCKKYHLAYITTFKEGSLPAGFQEYETLLKLLPDQIKTTSHNGTRCRFRWANDLSLAEHCFHAFECHQTLPNGKRTRFVWATNIPVSASNVEALSQKGGRLRWKVENEGFNSQKNGGFALEHAYCENWTAARHLYFLLQIAHFIFQLICLGSLLKHPPPVLFGSLKAFAQRLLEAWRNALLDPLLLHSVLARPFQIRIRSP